MYITRLIIPWFRITWKGIVIWLKSVVAVWRMLGLYKWVILLLLVIFIDSFFFACLRWRCRCCVELEWRRILLDVFEVFTSISLIQCLSSTTRGTRIDMVNSLIAQVLAKIERKLVGYNGPTEKPLGVKKQVQDLIGEATDIENLSQGTLAFSFSRLLDRSDKSRTNAKTNLAECVCADG